MSFFAGGILAKDRSCAIGYFVEKDSQDQMSSRDTGGPIQEKRGNFAKGQKKLELHGSRVSATMRDTAINGSSMVRARRYSACRSRHEN